ncbi:MAG: ribonuclease III [Eubacteriales bacterium]|nr:ribonuclease III [Eubacteriales bacterium]
MSRQTQKLEHTIGYIFTDKKLLEQALTHSSYANEKKLGKLGCNERLEFLGDAVLELISSDFLFARFPDLPEGELTKKRASLVCEPSLAYCAREFGLPKYLLLGKGEDMTGGRNRDSIVSDATEALLGAIYLDGGFASAKEFVQNFILNDIEHKQLFFDSKTILQEIVQEDGAKTVEYQLLREEGPDHDKKFTVNVVISGKVMGTGVGHTKKAAEQAAAYKAIRKIKQQVEYVSEKH